MDYKDYYAILGLQRNANTSEIKKAYRKLARQYHPDVNSGDPQAEQKFKEVNEAYTVLSDIEKRQIYDRFGSQWQQYERAGKSFDWSQWYKAGGARQPQGRTVTSEEFEQIFGGSSFSDFFQQIFGAGMVQPRGGSRSSHPSGFGLRSTAQTVPLEISLEESFHGTKRTIQQGSYRFEVTIPIGVKSGSTVRAGSLLMTVTVKPHKIFVVDGNNLRTKVPVDLYDALLGGEVHVPTLQGTVALVIPSDTQNGKVFRLQGQGMPDVKDNSQRGDLLVEVVVVLPVPLSSAEKRQFEALQKKFSD